MLQTKTNHGLKNKKGGKMVGRDLTKLTTEHLENLKRYCQEMLASYPGEQTYTGDSDGAESAVECENNHNRQLKEELEEQSVEVEEELRKREKNKEELM